MALQDVTPRGTIYSWTRVHRAFGNPPAPVPYVTVVVTIDDAVGVRLVCLMDCADTPVIGGSVALQPDFNDKGNGRWLCHPTA